MEGIAEWLAKITWPLVTRVLSSMGAGTVTYVGADSALTAALTQVKTSFVGMTSDILAILAIAGFFDAMSIMAGGIISGLSWLVMKRFAMQTTGTQT